MRSFPVEAKYTFEVEIGLSGTYQPGSPATPPSYARGGYPPEYPSVEDVEIVSIGGLRYDEFAAGRRIWTTTDLLAGVDRKSEAYQQICANLLAFMGDEAEQALIDQAGEGA